MHRLRGRAGAMAGVVFAIVAVLIWMVGSRVGVRAVAATADTVTVSIIKAPMINGCPAPSPATAAYCLQPSSVTAPAGGTVKWTNTTRTVLTLQRCGTECPGGGGTGGDSPFGVSGATLNQNGSYSFTFTGAGTYYYDCSASPCAIGEVTVTPASSPTPVQLSPGAGTGPSHSPTPTPTPTPIPSLSATPTPATSPSDTSSAVALTTPSSDMSPAASGSFPLVAGGNSGGGSPLVIIVLIILTLVAVGGGVLTFRLSRR
jgi:plastocyanin